MSGNHAEIARWRRQQSLSRTLARRPELLEDVQLSRDDSQFLRTLAVAEA
jgi:tRNA (guanine37-N1)-methyltransferase